jgi:ubiquinone biosynthesis protein UbiJ
VKADRRNKGFLSPLQVTVFDERERHESVEERTEQKLRVKQPKLKDCSVDQFMSQVRPLIRESTDRADSVPEDLTPEQRAANAAEIETMRQQIADLQGEVEKLECRQQLSDLPVPDYRKSKPLVQ